MSEYLAVLPNELGKMNKIPKQRWLDNTAEDRLKLGLTSPEAHNLGRNRNRWVLPYHRAA